MIADIKKEGSRAIAVKANITPPPEVEQLFAEAKKAYGRVDVLVNNAGLYDFQPLEAISLELFRKHFDLNVFGCLLAIKEAVKYMPEGGSFVNMSSTVTLFGPANASVNEASKGAMDGMARALSNELAPKKIRVNAFKPGVVATEGVETGGFPHSDFGPAMIADTSLRRLGVPNDIAPAAVYLASDESSWTTGEFITLAGGQR